MCCREAQELSYTLINICDQMMEDGMDREMTGKQRHVIQQVKHCTSPTLEECTCENEVAMYEVVDDLETTEVYGARIAIEKYAMLGCDFRDGR